MKKFFYALAFVAISLWFLGPLFFIFLASLTPSSEFYQWDRIFLLSSPSITYTSYS